MKTAPPAVAAALLILLAGCATTQPVTAPPPQTQTHTLYTSHEKAAMSLCMSMSVNAYSIAVRKLAGTPAATLKAHYLSQLDPAKGRLMVSEVETIYAANFRDPFSYTASFFRECALHVAAVPEDRSKPAAFCTLNAVIGDIAARDKRAGKPKSVPYEYFAPLHSKTPDQIIDHVYAESMRTAEVPLSVWNSCMAPLTGR
jgi:hypothetical protein